jgi:2-polyprenyl-3-methyl-5-hydroxy-6-metoxy-1,4-benzoquinol methylase
MTYDSESVRAYFDAFGEREWDRLDDTLQGRSNYAIHKRFLDEYVTRGTRALDIGAGPGRFAIDLIELGAGVTVADISQVQLDLARTRIKERGLLDLVVAFRQLDVLDLKSIDNDTYDVVVCFGGVVSYTREHYASALAELARVIRPNGLLLLSVMSLYGALRLVGPLDAASALETIDEHLDLNAVLSGEQVVFMRQESTEFHQPLALFTSVGLIRALSDAGLSVEKLASANSILTQYSRVPKLEASAAARDALQKLEAVVAGFPGLLDAGGHLVAAARRR